MLHAFSCRQQIRRDSDLPLVLSAVRQELFQIWHDNHFRLDGILSVGNGIGITSAGKSSAPFANATSRVVLHQLYSHLTNILLDPPMLHDAPEATSPSQVEGGNGKQADVPY